MFPLQLSYEPISSTAEPEIRSDQLFPLENGYQTHEIKTRKKLIVNTANDSESTLLNSSQMLSHNWMASIQNITGEMIGNGVDKVCDDHQPLPGTDSEFYADDSNASNPKYLS